MSVVPRIAQTRPPEARDLVGAPARPMAAFMRHDRSPVFRGWHPTLRDASSDTIEAWSRASARATDMIQNSGWIAGAIDQAVANTVGTGLSLSSKPDAAALGITVKEASELGRQIERRFELWASNPYECDIEGRRTFGQYQASSFRAWFPYGEIVSECAWKRRPGGVYGTKFRMIPAHRLSQRTELPRLSQGVRMDADWMPLSYVFWRKQGLSDQEIEVAARDAAGRVRIAHVFDGMPGQYRGISPLTPALSVARRFDQLSDAHLTASLIRKVFAATIKSKEPTEEVLKGLLTQQEQARMKSEGLSAFDCWAEMNEGWYRNTTIDLGQNGRFAHLFPGQELDFHHADSQSDFKDQALFLLRELLRCLGLTYESGTGDYTNATYSSVRMATGEIFAITLYRRKNVVGPASQPLYEGWLEEEIDNGAIVIPGGMDAFIEKRAAVCRAEWRGTAKPQADDLKLAKAHETWKGLGVITDEMICADLGRDVEDVYEQLARERDMREQFGLPEPGGVTRDPVADKLLTQED